MDINESPSNKLIENALMFGWTYIEDGYFERDNLIGYFNSKGHWQVA